MYSAYNESFFNQLLSNSKFETSYKALKDTSIWERFMLNIAQFSAAKSTAESSLIQSAMIDDKGKMKEYEDFKEDAKKITEISQETWLRTEYEACKRSSIMGEEFRRMQQDSDLYPFWVYHGVMDDKEREEHVALEGLVFRIGDPNGDNVYPPNGWNCRCTAESVDGRYLKENNTKALTTEQSGYYLNNNVDEQFRKNSGVDGVMPNTGSYFETFSFANKGNPTLFGLDKSKNIDVSDIIGLGSEFQNFMETVNKWRSKYPKNKEGDIIIQNDDLLINARLTDNALHKIQKHQKGFENIPGTIKHPNEVWALWSNPYAQKDVMMSYILFGKKNYIVLTKNSVIIDAFIATNTTTEKYRKGVIL